MLNGTKKKIKAQLNAYGREHTRFRTRERQVMGAYYWMHNQLDTFYLRTNPKMVIFASFEGRSYSDSPKALFEYMISCGAFDSFTFVWGFKTGAGSREKELRGIMKRLCAQRKRKQGEEGPKLIVVRYNSVEWRKYQAQAKFWIYNFKIPDEISPRKDQVFLQCWHGTPLKRLGFDLTHFDSATNTEEGIKKRYAREVKKFTYFLTTCPFATEKFISAWRMDDFGKTDCILEGGYPRNDILINYTEADVTDIKKRLFGEYYPDYEAQVKKKTIILYAPTYRPNEYEAGKGHVMKMAVDFDRMRERFGDDCMILFRPHYFIADLFDFERYRGFVYNVSDYDDINDLYLISDMMITDYSSTMFDYAILKRPMIFYMYDLEHYRDESNGFYFDPYEVLPGPIVKTQEDLFEAVSEAMAYFEYDEAYRKFNETFNPCNDGRHSARIVRKVFGRRKGNEKAEKPDYDAQTAQGV